RTIETARTAPRHQKKAAGNPATLDLASITSGAGTAPPALDTKRSASPWTKVIDASVMTRGWTLNTATPTPLARPIAMAANRAAGTASAGSTLTMMTLVRLTTEPTERSTPPTKATISWPSAMMSSAVIWLLTFAMFWSAKKSGARTDSKKNMRSG